MAQQVTRVNLTADHFPFLSILAGRDIFVKNYDQTYVTAISNREDTSRVTGTAIPYYLHNVIATEQGYQSIGYQQITAPVIGALNFVDVFPVYEASSGGKAYIGYTEDGKFYYCKDPYYTWTLVTTISAAAGKAITSCFINGITYFYIANVGCKRFNFSTNAFVDVTLAGLTAANILGITAVMGYMIAWTVDFVAWSSLISPTDFTPSLATGAGGGSVQGAKGNIVACVAHTTGFMVYTNQNAVAASLSGNTRYPFNFREIVASGGLASGKLVTPDALSGNHYAYTTSGLQSVSLQTTQVIFPELTDFLAGAVFEDFDENTRKFTITKLAGKVMKKRLQLISDRYLVISYGIDSFTHALIYDTAHKRWGKLKAEHVAVFEFSLLQAETVETPRRSIALLGKDGQVQVVSINTLDQTSKGVIFLGRYSWTRSRLTTFETVQIENLIPGAAFACYDWITTANKTQLEKVGYKLEGDDLSATYAFSTTGIDHSTLLIGGFNLVSMVISTHVNGRR